MRTKDFRIQQEQRIKNKKSFINKNGRGYPISYSKEKVEKTTNDGIKVVFYFKEYSLGNNYSYLKNRLANKRVRHYKKSISNRGGYKKVFDLWWNAF